MTGYSSVAEPTDIAVETFCGYNNRALIERTGMRKNWKTGVQCNRSLHVPNKLLRKQIFDSVATWKIIETIVLLLRLRNIIFMLLLLIENYLLL